MQAKGAGEGAPKPLVAETSRRRPASRSRGKRSNVPPSANPNYNLSLAQGTSDTPPQDPEGSVSTNEQQGVNNMPQPEEYQDALAVEQGAPAAELGAPAAELGAPVAIQGAPTPPLGSPAIQGAPTPPLGSPAIQGAPTPPLRSPAGTSRGAIPKQGAQERFTRASEAMRAAARRHAHAVLSESSSDEETDGERSSAIIEKVMNSYMVSPEDRSQVSRTIHFLEESLSSGSASCLICIGKIKIKDAIWNCTQCHTMMHLTCVQQWANDSIKAVLFKTEWNCPKCRKTYSKSDIPKKYICFCTDMDDPQPHPWLLPHSCGSNCGKLLEPACGHRCVLLCHPGPCPPCPRIVQESCYCGRGGVHSLRCSNYKWTCGSVCGRLLGCVVHTCARRCHAGDCPPCELTVESSCICGRGVKRLLCGSPLWQCDQVCGKMLACDSHLCTRICHTTGKCEPCPNSGSMTCPCGAERAVIRCPELPPLCGGTCNKSLPCGQHACPEKCHRGECPPCVMVVMKRCACGGNVKSLPCSGRYTCEGKCRKRPCSQHTCNRRCCVQCPPCERPCNKPLSCGKHKCKSPCHLGPCYPCPLQSKVACRCGGSFYMVNCGRKRFKLPVCNMPCQEKFDCGHTSKNVHKCHFGDCPPCKAKCDKPLPNCNHRCQAQCHANVQVVFSSASPPATPAEAQSQRVRTMRLHCPPCAAAVAVVCLGGHDSVPQACHRARRAPCGRPCGAPLSCGNHTCTRLCHLIVPEAQMSDTSSECETCTRECAAPRPPHCQHRCPRGLCHPPPCPSCVRQQRVHCHCGAHSWHVSCNELENADDNAVSCLNRCIKSKDCGHRCSDICHTGPCPPGRDCTKTVKVFCPCRTIKEEAECRKARSGEVSIKCSVICEDKKNQALQQKQEEVLKQQLLQAEKDRKELEQYQRKFNKGGKKKQKIEKIKIEPRNDNQFWWAMAVFIIVFAFLAGVIWFRI